MTQIGTPKSKRKGTGKISLFCMLTTLLGMSLSTLMIFHRFQQATRQHMDALETNGLKPPRQAPKSRKTREEREAESYMKTGRKPRHVDAKFSERKIEGNIYELKHEDQPRHFQLAAPIQKHAVEESDARVEENVKYLHEKKEDDAPKKHVKRTHFYEDQNEPEADLKEEDILEDAKKAVTSKPAKRGFWDKVISKPKTKNGVPENILAHWKHASNALFKSQLRLNAANAAQFQNQQSDNSFQDPIHFIDFTQVSKQDTFSASWMQRREEFLSMPLENVQICEDAAWEAWDTRPEKLRMTLDYMDLSVEHLSKWWKFLSFYNTPVAYDTIIRVLNEYLQRGDQFPTPPLDQLMMPDTLSMIAFQPYLHKKEEEKHYNLTITSLAATIESIRRAQIGRVVVVGLVDNGHDIAQESFRYLAEHVPGVRHQRNNQGVVTKIGHLEVGYARGSATIARSKHLEKNIPRAVLYGTRTALQLGDVPAAQRHANETEYVREWLGDEHSPSYWKYLYLTEPDTLLNARQSAIPQLKAQLDQGNILAPHRLQPIPHESDLKGLANRFRFLNEDNGFDNVWEIDPSENGSHDVCCDEHQGPDTKPGKDRYGDCGTWWYMCGFKKDYTDKSLGDVHERLRPYSFMKLKGGTGLTLMAGNLFGRRCFPAKHTVCKPPPQ